MGKLETSGHKGWWPMLQHRGKTRSGEKVVQEVFRNMVTGEVYRPEDGWNGSPPTTTGEPIRQANDLYRENYDKIRWNK